MDNKKVYLGLRSHLAEFIKVYADNNADDWKSKALKITYRYSETDSDNTPNDNAIQQLGKTPWYVQDTLRSIAKDFCDGLIAKQDDAIIAFKKGMGHVEVKEKVMAKFGFGHDEKTLRFYLDGLGFSVSEQKDAGNYCINAQYYGRETMSILREVIPDVKKYLRSNPVPVLLEQLLVDLKADKQFDMIQLAFAKDYVKADTDYLELIEKDGDIYVTIKWEKLSVADRTVRLLYDYGLQNGFDAYMTRDQLIRAYDTKAYQFDGIDPFPASQSIAKDDHIESLKSGSYRYIGNPKNKRAKIDLKSELLKYISIHQGIATFAELRNFVDDNGWKYSDIAIKSYLHDDCVTALKEGEGKKAYYILKTCWPEYETQGFRKAKKASTAPKKPTPPPSYKTAIIHKAIQLLKEAPDHSLPKKVLVEAVVDLYPGKSITNVYKIFNDDPAFEKKGSGKGSSYVLAEVEDSE